MATRLKSYPSSPGFIVDPKSVTRNSGRQIDWSLVTGTNYGTAPNRVIKAGTIVSEVTASGKVVPRALGAAGTSGAVGVLETAAHETSESDSLSGFGVIVAGNLHGNRLPDAGDAAFATMKTELGARFYYEDAFDGRAS